MIRSDSTMKSYSSLHISHCQLGDLTVPPLTKFDLQSNIFKMTPRTKLSHEFEMTECLGPPLYMFYKPNSEYFLKTQPNIIYIYIILGWVFKKHYYKHYIGLLERVFKSLFKRHYTTLRDVLFCSAL